jgi:hypothetical protein
MSEVGSLPVIECNGHLQELRGRANALGEIGTRRCVEVVLVQFAVWRLLDRSGAYWVSLTSLGQDVVSEANHCIVMGRSVL